MAFGTGCRTGSRYASPFSRAHRSAVTAFARKYENIAFGSSRLNAAPCSRSRRQRKPRFLTIAGERVRGGAREVVAIEERYERYSLAGRLELPSHLEGDRPPERIPAHGVRAGLSGALRISFT